MFTFLSVLPDVPERHAYSTTSFNNVLICFFLAGELQGLHPEESSCSGKEATQAMISDHRSGAHNFLLIKALHAKGRYFIGQVMHCTI